MTSAWPPERVFMAIALSFGLLFVFLTPPLQVADEDSHFKKAYAVAHGAFFPTLAREGGVPGNYLPQSVLEFEGSLRYMIGNPDKKYGYMACITDTAVRKPRGEERFAEYSSASENPLLYLPQATGMLFGRMAFSVVGGPELYTPAARLYFGRAFNLLAYLVLVYLAIAVIPILKLPILFVSLLPMSLTIAASLNRDALVTAGAFCLVALTLRLMIIERTKVSRKETVALSLLTTLLLTGKQVYFPLVALLAFIPADRFNGKRDRIQFYVVVLGSAVGVFLLLAAIGAWRTNGAVDPNASFIGAQWDFMISHPIKTAGILLTTLWDMRFAYMVGAIGNLGWLDTTFPYPFAVICFFVLLLLALLDTEHEAWRLPWGLRVTAVAACCASILAFTVGFYLLWTPLPHEAGVGAPVVTGIQGRYFLPLAPAALLALRNRHAVRLRADRVLRAGLPFFLIFVQCLTASVLLIRYWIPA